MTFWYIMFNYRLENLELMSKHGPEVWRQHNQRLEALLLGFVSILLQGVLFLIFVIITTIHFFFYLFKYFFLFFLFWGGEVYWGFSYECCVKLVAPRTLHYGVLHSVQHGVLVLQCFNFMTYD